MNFHAPPEGGTLVGEMVISALMPSPARTHVLLTLDEDAALCTVPFAAALCTVPFAAALCTVPFPARPVWSCDACLCQPLILSLPQSLSWSMYAKSSSHVITPGAESGSTKSGQVHEGYACTSRHIDSQMPASLF